MRMKKIKDPKLHAPKVPIYIKYFLKPIPTGIQEIPLYVVGIFTNVVKANRLIENDRLKNAISIWNSIQRRGS